jgi:putative transposase
MPNYRRAKVAGATYFFTVNLQERCLRLLVEHIDVLQEVIEWVREVHPVHVDAWVVMPEHMHVVWTLPPGDSDFALRWSSIKRRFSKALPATEQRSAVQYARGERGIWQRRFWEHMIRDDLDYERHVDYIHYNPVKHGHVTRVADWPHSSFRQYVDGGIYPVDWGGDGGIDISSAGERV